jgi:hypothetical protein
MMDHVFFNGAKKATSRGCERYVELGGKQLKEMLFLFDSFSTAKDRCKLRLSQIMGLGPSIFLAWGKN